MHLSLKSRRRIYHGAVGTAVEQSNEGHIERVIELPRPHFGLSSEYEKGVDYA